MFARQALLLGALGLLGAALAAAKEPPAGSEDAIILENELGMQAHILRTGASLQRLLVPGPDGELVDVILGWGDEAFYANGSNPQMGSTVGRVGGRIANHTFTLDGDTYLLDANAGNDTLHSGHDGLDKRVFEVADQGQDDEGSWVTMTYTSPAGDMGFPGQLIVNVTFTLAANATELSYDVAAVTDQATPVAIYAHPYWNLGGHDSGSVLNHTLWLNSSYYLPYAPGSFNPSGQLAPVAGTIYDFSQPTPLGEHIHDPQLEELGGYDNVWALFGLDSANLKQRVQDFQVEGGLQLAATLVDPASGRGLDILTNAPAGIVYTGNWLDPSLPAKDGARYEPYSGVAIEVAQLPNSVNEPRFPSVILQPGEVYENHAVWRFFDAR